MLVVDLACPQGHRFEGWFASADDLASQQARGLVSCPVCGDLHVQRLPSAPHLNVSHREERALEPNRTHPAQAEGQASSRTVNDMSQLAQVAQGHRPASGQGEPHGVQADDAQALQALYWSAVRHVLQHTEDVGERFASDARAMHHGELPPKPIRGQLDAQEREALKDEGIEVVTLVVPKGLDGPVQ